MAATSRVLFAERTEDFPQMVQHFVTKPLHRGRTRIHCQSCSPAQKERKNNIIVRPLSDRTRIVQLDDFDEAALKGVGGDGFSYARSTLETARIEPSLK
jgi:hypothetical protein